MQDGTTHGIEGPSVDKATRRYFNLRGSAPSSKHETAAILKSRYERRRAAIERFTDRLEKTGGYVDEAERLPLLELGVTEIEIDTLVAQAQA